MSCIGCLEKRFHFLLRTRSCPSLDRSQKSLLKTFDTLLPSAKQTVEQSQQLLLLFCYGEMESVLINHGKE